MEIIIDYLKGHKLLTLFGVALIFSAIFLITTSALDKEGPAGPDDGSEAVNFNSIAPGVSTEETVIEQLGEPLSVTEEGLEKTLEYQSTSPTRKHEVTVEEAHVSFIKEIVSINDDTRAEDLIRLYGNPSARLYQKNDPQFAFSLYVYPEKGLAYLGHEDGTLLEIWYFPTTSLGGFISKYAPGYSPTIPLPDSTQSY